MRRFAFIISFLIACLSPISSPAGEARPRSVLVLDQSDVRGPFYYEVFSSLRSIVTAEAGAPVTIYAENLDLSRFSGPTYEASLQQHLLVKFRDRPIGLVVAIGSASLEYVLRWRPTIWPGAPVVFAMVDEPAFARLKPPPDVTGLVMKLRLSDMISAAHAVVPGLRRVAFVGDPWRTQIAYRHWAGDIPAATAGMEVIDLTGLPMEDLRKRASELPDHTAILYSAIYSDGKGTFYPPADALALIATTANRPIVVSAETFIGTGAIGGFVMRPALIGQTVARLALRILNGESAASIPVAPGDVVRPMFDWRQMQRWGVSTSRLPAGSEILFREPTVWDLYHWQIFAVATVLLLQTALIARLISERGRRNVAEVQARQRMAELAHMNRRATAGEMSASLAHELNQPLGAILSNAEAAEILLNAPSPKLAEIKEILGDIRRDDERASDVIRHLRSLLKKTAFEPQQIDLNETVREVFDFLSVQASARNVTIASGLTSHALRVRGDRIHLQQVLINLIVNAIDATTGVPTGQRRITGHTIRVNGCAEVSIADSGSGIPSDKLTQVFEPFFTTKEQGMGMGLSIARTIVEAHGGRIWAENQASGGAVFRLSLPLVNAG
ncbi:MAG TPA: sensor histidine kinase [Xanthobacteraceae bacterium]|jgi:signal transduction histidine kinase